MSTAIQLDVDHISGTSLRDGRIIPRWATHVAVRHQHRGVVGHQQAEFAALSMRHGGYIDCDPGADVGTHGVGATVGLYNPEIWQFIPVMKTVTVKDAQ